MEILDRDRIAGPGALEDVGFVGGNGADRSAR